MKLIITEGQFKKILKEQNINALKNLIRKKPTIKGKYSSLGDMTLSSGFNPFKNIDGLKNSSYRNIKELLYLFTKNKKDVLNAMKKTGYPGWSTATEDNLDDLIVDIYNLFVDPHRYLNDDYRFQISKTNMSKKSKTMFMFLPVDIIDDVVNSVEYNGRVTLYNKNFSPEPIKVVSDAIINNKPLVFYHGGLPKEATIADIDVLRRSQRQQKKNSNYGGFYMSPDIEKNSFALQYHQANPGSGLHKITLPAGSKGYNYTLGTVERIDISTLMDLQKKGYDYISGKNVFGKPEFILLNTKKADLKLISGKSIKTTEDSLDILYWWGNPNKKTGFIEFGSKVEWPNHSGWKFHIFGTTLEDSAFLIERLTPVTKKYGAHAKVGGLGQVNHVNMKPGTPQHGKQGATIYIPTSVIEKNQHGAMLSDIKSAIQGYNNKGGNIMGDKMITPQIHYRYELNAPLPTGGLKNEDEYYNVFYNKNSGGPYKPDNVVDIFSSNKITKTIPINYLSTKFGDTSEIDWSKILNATNIKEYDIVINDAIKTNNYSKISRGGFESYGITDFREYLKNNYNK